MKKYILSLVAVLCIASSQAQEFSLGAKVGLNVSSMGMHGEDIEGRQQYRSPMLGVSAGLTAEYKFEKPISLSLEALFSQQGVKYNYDKQAAIDGSACKVTHRYSYLNFPILFNYYFVKDLPLSLNIGVQPGIMLNNKQEIELSGGGNSAMVDQTTVSWAGGYYKFDLAIPIGLTYDITKHFTIGARYSVGVLNILDAPNDVDYDKDFGATNNNLTLSIGVKF